MFIQFEKSKLKLEEIREGKVSLKLLSPHEKAVIKHIKNWIGGEDFFSFHTSGSTGKPKNIKIRRSKVEYSCQATMEKIDPSHNFKSAFLCINPEMIGGAMVIFRSLIRQLNLTVVKPTSNPFQGLSVDQRYDLTSIVPMQLYQATTEMLNHFNTILVGGAGLAAYTNESSAKIYSSFGMTETVSHFALRDIETPYFECIGDVQLIPSTDNRLKIKGTITDGRTLTSNDVIGRVSTRKFRWIARADFLINTGGIKINPEEVEAKLSVQIMGSFLISSLPDRKLGNKLVLILEEKSSGKEMDFTQLSKYEIPKETHLLEKIHLTTSGKIDRLKNQEELIRKLKESE
ncbi:MAG: AMP-binding protein [Bacteroidota bacterium]